MMTEISNNKALRKSVFGLGDGFGRVARYLRMSITDRCNFNCFYCRGDKKFIPHERIMRYEHFFRLAKIAQSLGIRKIRLTGGEPFARKGCAAFMSNLARNFPQIALALTTNGSLLGPYIQDIAKIRPVSVNLSLDSFDSSTFTEITGKNMFAEVLENLDRLLMANIKVKINAVAIRGVTDAGINDFIHAARIMPVDIRFIEFMPMGVGTLWTEEKFLPVAELLELARSRAKITETPQVADPLAGPARMYELENAKGRLGFISAVSNHFCATCNRLRITSSGNLRSCLFDDREYRLRNMLANEKISDSAIARILSQVCARKPFGAHLLAASNGPVSQKIMSGIGG